MSEAPKESRRISNVALVRSTVALLVYMLLPIICSWNIRWTRGWIYAAATLAVTIASLAILAKTNPGIIRARAEARLGTSRFEKIGLAIFAPVLLAIFIVAGLDGGRYHWSRMPGWLLYVGLLFYFGGSALVIWVMSVNPFAEPSVRIQAERGHRVITTGPYRYVRHPMYSSSFVMFAGWPLILDSWWAFIPATALAALIVVRTVFEDRFLKQNLPGYEEYARKTRYRLVPLVW